MRTIQIRIFGRVQGVFFRESMRQRALALGITGWVRNRTDGSVEALIQGNSDAVARMREWALRGPPAARVDRIEETPGSGEAYETFERWPNA